MFFQNRVFSDRGIYIGLFGPLCYVFPESGFLGPYYVFSRFFGPIFFLMFYALFRTFSGYVMFSKSCMFF